MYKEHPDKALGEIKSLLEVNLIRQAVAGATYMTAVSQLDLT